MFSTDITRERNTKVDVFKASKQPVAFIFLKTGIILSYHTIFDD